MFRFVETICIQNGVPKLLNLHQERLDMTFERYYPHNRAHKLSSLIKMSYASGLQKCRFLYNKESYRITYENYKTRPVNSLAVVHDHQIVYSYKYLDRKNLVSLFDKRKSADDIIIVKNGWVTDSHHANLALFDGSQWYTSNQPLLEGIKRKSLIEIGNLKVIEIKINDIASFQKICLINAMMDIGQVEIPLEKVIF